MPQQQLRQGIERLLLVPAHSAKDALPNSGSPGKLDMLKARLSLRPGSSALSGPFFIPALPVAVSQSLTCDFDTPKAKARGEGRCSVHSRGVFSCRYAPHDP
jgi:hypothetical protein